MEMANAGVGLGDALMLAKQGSNGNEMWNNPFVYLILLAAFGGGFGGFGGWGGNGSAFQGTVTRAELSEGLDNQDIKASLRGIQSGLCDGFYTVGMNEKETGS